MSTIKIICKIICDARRAGKSDPADLHDQSGHHRYYGSSAESGGDRYLHDAHCRRLFCKRRAQKPQTLIARGRLPHRLSTMRSPPLSAELP